MLAETNFWTIPEQPCLYSSELKERSGWKGGVRNSRKVFSSSFLPVEVGVSSQSEKFPALLQDSLKEYPP